MTLENYVIELRRYFHRNPEPSLKEYETANKIEEELNKLNIPNKRVGETGIIGFIGSDGGRKIALRADIDALEIEDKKDAEYKSQNKGLMHACGHDAHTAMLLGAARSLKEREKELKGQVLLCFQQAEEIGQGARIFVEEGYLEGVEASFALHVASGVESGKIVLTKGPRAASCDYFKAEITGRSGHVSKPHDAVDALFIGAESVMNLQSIVSRQTDPLDPVVLGIGVLNSGTRYNIIANKAVIEGTFRTFSEETRKNTKKAIEKILTSTAEMNKGEVEIEFKDFASPLINDEDATNLAVEAAGSIFGEENIIEDGEKSLGADDFAEFLIHTKGVYGQLGTRNPNLKNTNYGHHHELFDLDESSLIKGTKLYVEYCILYFRNGI